MGFKEMVEWDNANVFLNTEEFAELHTIKYDGETYERIPVVLTQNTQESRKTLKDDTAYGVYRVTATAYISKNSLGGVIPEKGHEIRIDNQDFPDNPYYTQYRIVTSKCDMGMICLELEDCDD